MSDRYMLATKFQGKIVDVVRLTNWGRRSILPYGIVLIYRHGRESDSLPWSVFHCKYIP